MASLNIFIADLFLLLFHFRLAQEREDAKAKKEKSTTGNPTLLEKMGAVDFHMKAVPGTEVPGHKVSPSVDRARRVSSDLIFVVVTANADAFSPLWSSRPIGWGFCLFDFHFQPAL